MNWSCSSNLIICILELAEGITHLLRKCRSSAPFSVTSNLSLFKSSPNSFSYARALAGSIPCVRYFWSWRRESNPQPADYKSAALPLSHASILYHILKMATWNGLEPSTSSVTGWHSNQLNYQAILIYGGRNRARTYDPLLVRQVLSQLSYAPLALSTCSYIL